MRRYLSGCAFVFIAFGFQPIYAEGYSAGFVVAVQASADKSTPFKASGVVTHVFDGDTVDLLSESGWKIRIRLADIDAPEVAHPGKPGQSWGEESRQALRFLVYGKSVQAGCSGAQSYGRTVCRIIVDGLDAGKEMVRAGNAWAAKSHLAERVFLGLQLEAKRARRGLWSQANPVPPWEWRHSN